MHNHIYIYPDDIKSNYNSDGKTLTGVCKYCGAKQKSLGRRWSIPVEENFLQQIPYGKSNFIFGNPKIIYYNNREML
jgi:hypothetical protein